MVDLTDLVEVFLEKPVFLPLQQELSGETVLAESVCLCQLFGTFKKFILLLDLLSELLLKVVNLLSDSGGIRFRIRVDLVS